MRNWTYRLGFAMVIALMWTGPSVYAASPIDEALSAIKSLFRAKPTAPQPTPQSPSAQSAFTSATRLKQQGATSKAIAELRQAAQLGHAGAAYELGMLYLQGDQVTQDLALAAQWFNRAADGGDSRAQYLVGANLLSGTGVDRDPARGVGFLARAGEQGHPRAQYLLGQAYIDGVGVVPNPYWAARWYSRAARAGHAQAQFAYGVMRGSGLGVPRDDGDAYRWLTLAATAQVAGASNLARSIERRLDVQSVSEAHTDIATFRPRTQARLTDVATVLFVQATLERSGFDPGPLDGLFGARTRAGIRSLQAQLGMAKDGQISSHVLQHLIDRTSRPRTPASKRIAVQAPRAPNG